jgi:urease accessory protein
VTATTLTVELVEGRHQVRMRHGLLRAQRLHGPPDRARVALVGQTALLLGGDEVELQIEMGSGAVLELSEVAGTVAYAGRGRRAKWTTNITLGRGAQLTWAGEPLVVADGARVTRRTSIDLSDDASAILRETIVLGRSGEVGGAIRSRMRVQREGSPILIEDLLLDPQDRHGPGLLGQHRVIDSLLVLGADTPDTGAGAVRFELAEPASTLIRYLGSDLAQSPLARPPSRAVPVGTDILQPSPMPTDSVA